MRATEGFARLERALSRAGRDTSDYDLNADMAVPPGRRLQPAAVLVGFQRQPGGLGLVLTKRASHLKHHPGQIALPGGKIDEGDRTPVDAALREAWEEIGLPRENVRILGQIDPHETVTGYRVTPVLAEIDPSFVPRADPSEVEDVFHVPFDHLCQPGRFMIESRTWRGTVRRYFILPYGPYYIWGATARILKALSDRMVE